MTSAECREQAFHCQRLADEAIRTESREHMRYLARCWTILADADESGPFYHAHGALFQLPPSL